ncbi:hypothetical protein BJP40_06550 [Streptomyces sp. CC53]|uniref:hypothetical protein n=1 Tax=Streptomyces sp. CC53 TaxID=1906740 RepID=UPI0008DE4935|nr:hypothetical protein [Streptomyces sp. CC53]OII61182.1 hypothetical protein BJP40_06550 [Streptomyces sp. CC53]
MTIINLGDLVHRICQRIDADPSTVFRLNITPTELTVHTHVRNDNGNYMWDTITDAPAETITRFPISTQLSHAETNALIEERLKELRS